MFCILENIFDIYPQAHTNIPFCSLRHTRRLGHRRPDRHDLRHRSVLNARQMPFARQPTPAPELDTRIYPCGLSGWLDLNLDAALLAV